MGVGGGQGGLPIDTACIGLGLVRKEGLGQRSCTLYMGLFSKAEDDSIKMGTPSI